MLLGILVYDGIIWNGKGEFVFSGRFVCCKVCYDKCCNDYFNESFLDGSE